MENQKENIAAAADAVKMIVNLISDFKKRMKVSDSITKVSIFSSCFGPELCQHLYEKYSMSDNAEDFILSLDQENIYSFVNFAW